MAKQKNTITLKQMGITMALVGFCVGYIFAAVFISDSSDDVAMDMNTNMHTHQPLDVSDYEAVPEVSLTVEKDSKSGWNLTLETENFEFAPENASQAHIDGQGHAHVYVDGVKITRVYSQSFYLNALEPGEHEITVGLSTNDHKDYFDGDRPIEASVTILEE